jgi:hypothetical protein
MILFRPYRGTRFLGRSRGADAPRGRCRRDRAGGRASAALLVALAACGISEPIEDRLVGIVDEEAEGVPAVSVPEQVVVAEAFEVTVRTVGGACVRKGDTEVESGGDTATVTPYDHFAVPRPGLGCIPTAETFQHTVELSFANAGDAWVVVRVRERAEGEPTELAYPVRVVP